MNKDNSSSINDLVFRSRDRGQTLFSRALLASGVLDIAGFALAFSSDDVVTSIVGYFNGPVGDLLVGAWDREVAVRDACRSTASDPRQSSRCPLGAHGLRLVRRVQVVAEFRARSCAGRRRSYQIDLRLNGAVVVVRGGRVVGVSPGEASAVGVFGFSRPGEHELHKIEQWFAPVVELPTYVMSAERRRRMVTA